MVPITTPDSIEFTEFSMTGPWIEAHPPAQYPTFKSYVAVSSEETPKFILLTPQKQRVTLDFKVTSQIYLDGYVFRYNKDNVENMQFESI